MAKRILFFVLVALLHQLVYAQAPGWQWARSSAGSESNAVCTDKWGNIYVTGYFIDSARLGALSLRAPGSGRDIFIAKYNPAGIVMWAKAFGSRQDDEGRSILADDSGNVFVAGVFGDTINFGGAIKRTVGIPGTPLGKLEEQDFFVLKMDTGASMQWVTTGGTAHEDQVLANSLASDHQGGLFLAGEFGGQLGYTNFSADTLSMNSLRIVNTGSASGFVTHINRSGDVIWLKGTRGSFGSVFTVVAATPTNELYVGGALIDTCYIDSHRLINTLGSSAGFIAKYNGNGDVVWARNLVSDTTVGSPSTIGAVATDTSGALFVTGEFKGYFKVDSSRTLTLTTPGSAFLAKFSLRGQAQWVTTPYPNNRFNVGYNSGSYGTGLVVDPAGNPIFTGAFTNDITFGADTPHADIQDAFVAKYSTDGRLLWHQQAGSTNYINPYCLASTSSSDDLLLCGSLITPTAAFGNAILENDSTRSMFLARLSRRAAAIANPSVEDAPVIYPNPAGDLIAILPGNQVFISYAITNALGQTVVSGRLQIGKQYIRFPYLSDGIYAICLLNRSGSTLTQKLTIRH